MKAPTIRDEDCVPDGEVSLPDWAECLLSQGPRYTILHGGRGSAKSMAFAIALVIRSTAAPLRILCFREVQGSIEESVKALIESIIAAVGLSDFFHITKKEIIGQNGSKFIFRGLNDETAESIKSLNDIDIAWGEEAQAFSQNSLTLLLPTIRKDTSEIWFSMNPDMDTDPVYVTFIVKRPANARIIEVNWDRNPFWNAALEAERLRSKADNPDDYENVWEGVPKAAATGAIYRREMHDLVTKGRIRPLLEDSILSLHAIFDIGINDKMAVTVAQADVSALRVTGYHEDNNYPIDHYCDWLKDTGRKDATIWLPHDGNARSVQTGVSTKRHVEALGWTVRTVPSVGLEAGILMTRRALKNTFFSDSDEVSPLLEHLRRYTRAKSGHPKHDDHSNGSDSFRYTAVSMVEFKTAAEARIKQAQVAAQVRVIPTVSHWSRA